MRSAFTLAGRKAVAAATAAGAATAAQPTAHARECVQQAPVHQAPKHSIQDDDWMLTDLDQEVLIFRPYKSSDVDEAVAQINAMIQVQGKRPTPASQPRGPLVSRPGLVIEELDDHELPHQATTPASRASTASDTSEGAEADHILTESVMMGVDMSASSSRHAMSTGMEHAGGMVPGMEMSGLLQITSRLLKSPGLQREVVKVMMEDVQVRELMMNQSRNLEAYLTSVGIHSSPLLPSTSASATITDVTDATGDEVFYSTPGASSHPVRDPHGHHPLDDILVAVKKCINTAGSALVGLGDWIVDKVGDLGQKLNGLFTGGGEQKVEGSCKEGAEINGDCKEKQQRRRTAGDMVMGGVVVALVAVMCVLLTRRPVLIRASGAAVGAAALHAQRKRN